MAHQRLRRAGVELDQVVEGEHQRLDALGGLAVLLFQRGDEACLGLAVEVVEDLRHHLVRIAPARLRQVGHKLGAQRVFQPLDHLLLDRLHAQHARDDVEGELFGQDREHARGVLRLDLGDHHRDGLRVFVLEIVREHLFLHVGELLPHVAAGRPADFLHDAADPLRRQVLLQQPLGRVVVAEQGSGRRHARDEFEQKVLDRLGLDRAKRGHHDRKLTQFVVVEQLPDLLAMLFAEREHQHGGAFGPS